MTVAAAGAVTLGFVLDVLTGEPPTSVHPVALFGRLVAPFDRDWQFPRLVGSMVALVLPLVAATVVGVSVLLAVQYDPWHPWTDMVAGGLALYVTTSLRMLLSEALTVVSLTETDLPAAREALLSLAGRDASDLDEGAVRSAAVESVGENLADGFVAPLLAFTLLVSVSLPMATAAAAWVKAVNTLDSMLGYRSKPVGFAPAKLDDLVMWLPARVSAVLIAQVARKPRALFRTRYWLDEVPSPNSGWPMGTLAAVLDVRLEKPNTYILNAGASLPSPQDARRGVELVGAAAVVAVLYAGVVAWV
ncbi:CobD/CbiB family cobalamin biosynthesis protein [Haloarchaeobius sp. DFWS5]|uniref:CobD/CbiB family cobalamin biosynthesis protein n=1 Tax=Haloarchaeobius sp. DFWS5 TaxID=3446114 RepID=UPI003EBC5614